MSPVEFLCRRISPPDPVLFPPTMLAQLPHSLFNTKASLSKSRNPLHQIPPLRPPASCVSHVALEIVCNIMKQTGYCVQRSLRRNAAFPSCKCDCTSQLLPPCSGYQLSSETCYLRLRTKGFRILKRGVFCTRF